MWVWVWTVVVWKFILEGVIAWGRAALVWALTLSLTLNQW